MPDPVYAPDFVLVVIAAWLGATVVARNVRSAGAAMFALLSLTVAVWAGAWTVRRLATVEAAQTVAGSITAIAGALLPALLVHLVLVLAGRRPWTSIERFVVALAYLVAIVFGTASALAADNVAFGPEMTFVGIPGPVINWSWVAFRVVVLGLAAWWVWAAQEGRGRDVARPQLVAIFGAVLFGAIGGGVTIVLDQLGSLTWPGTSLVAIAFVFAAYATFRSDLFFAPDTAKRILSYTLSGALLVAIVAVGVAAVDDMTRRTLGLDSPLPVAVVLVLILAFFEPVRNALRGAFVPATNPLGVRRLLVALGADAMDAGAEARLPTLLDELGRAVGSTAVSLYDSDGSLRAGTNAIATDDITLRIPVADGGELAVGGKRSGLPYTTAERDLLRQSASFIGSTISLDEVIAFQARAISGLSDQRDAVRAQEQLLSETLALGQAHSDQLDVYALGALHAARDGQAITNWGGPKAGTRQAEGLFAFLFDRGERGVHKDEIIELIWPDTDLDRADLAFHRTMGGLRRRLAASDGRGLGEVIAFHNDRYRLNEAVVRWSDLREFEEHLERARTAAGEDDRLVHLEAARRLYRGDYLDDCPFYGDSSDVEDRRQLLRGRFTDLLVELAEAHERRGDRPSAAGYFREAVRANGGACAPAEEGLARLRVAG